MSEFLDQYFETSNLNKKQESIEEQIEGVEEEPTFVNVRNTRKK